MPVSAVTTVEHQQLHIAALGPVRVRHGDAAIDLGAGRQLSFFMALATRPNATLSQRELLEKVWGLDPPGTGEKVVPVYVYRLRKLLRSVERDTSTAVISRDPDGYRFTHLHTWVDTLQLEKLAARARQAAQHGDATRAVEAYADALNLFRGEPLAGLPGPFAEGERQRLTERRLTLLQEKIELQLQAGWHADAVSEISSIRVEHPHSEALAALLMRSLYASGRRTDALAVFAQMRNTLVKDVGMEPGAELHRIQQSVLRGEERRSQPKQQAEPYAHIPPRPERHIRSDLPINMHTIVGRQTELATLATPSNAADVSIDVIDGVSGVGKSALALDVARRVRDSYPDGCFYLDLYGCVGGKKPISPQRALRRLLRSLGLEDNNIPDDDADELAAAWRAATSSRRIMLVLDDAYSADQVRPLIPAGPGSRVLITSRQRLIGLEMHRRLTVEPLNLRDATRLLTAILGKPQSRTEAAAAQELAELCDRLPLALRIAAARLQNRPSWTFEHMVSRLHDSTTRLSELTAGDTSIEAGFRLSYEQLAADEQQAFRALGLSPTVELDSRTLAAILDVSPTRAEELLEQLVDANLLQQHKIGRYRPHNLVAAYTQRLAAAEESSEARERVLRFFVAAARKSSDLPLDSFTTGPAFDTPPFSTWEEAASWLAAGENELIDVAKYAVRTGHANYACWLAEGLLDYFTRQDRYQTARDILHVARSALDKCTDERMRSTLPLCLGTSYILQGRYTRAHELFTESLEHSQHSGDKRDQARALCGLGIIARLYQQKEEAASQLLKGEELSREVGDDYITGMSMWNLGIIYQHQGEIDKAREYFASTVSLAEQIHSSRLLGKALSYYGKLLLDIHEYAEAATMLERSVTVASHIGDLPLRSFSLTRLGTAQQRLGETDAALALHREALSALTEQTSPDLTLEARYRLRETYRVTGQEAAAAEQSKLIEALIKLYDNSAEWSATLRDIPTEA